MKKGMKTAGHPVDVATGVVYTNQEDIRIPGKVDLVWERQYSTVLLENDPSHLGPGWTTNYFATLTRMENEYHFLSPEGEKEIFSDPKGKVENGGVIHNLNTFQEITRENSKYIITRWDIDTGEINRYIFREAPIGKAAPLQSIEDVTGQQALDLLYEEERLICIKQRLEKRSLHLHYSKNNQIEKVIFSGADNKDQVMARYEYDHKGRLCAAFDALGHVDRFEYDKDSRIIREIKKDGGVFHFKYDHKGRCVNTGGLDHYDEKTFRYMDQVGCTEVTDSLGHITLYQYLPTGQVINEINPVGASNKTEYDDHDRIIKKMDPNNAVIQYEYDEYGNRCKTIDPLGNVWELTFNEHHLPLKLKAPNGGEWKRIYDRYNRLIAAINPLGGRWEFTYDSDGNLIQIQDPKGAIVYNTFLPNGILKEASDWEGSITRFVYDQMGRIIEIIGPINDSTRFDYDPLSNLLRVIFADSSEINAQYDASGNLISFTDANGNITKFLYGPCGRLIEKIDPLGNSLKYEWGTEPGHLMKVINEKEAEYIFIRDSAGCVVKEQGFDNRVRSFEYDLAGHCIAIVNGLNQRIEYKRDAAGNILKQILPDKGTEEYSYDSTGNLSTAINSSCSVIFERDLIGRIIKESQDDYWIENSFDQVGNLIKKDTNQGLSVSYNYDKNGLVSSLRTDEGQEIRFKRNAYGDEIERILPGGHNLEQTYDNLGQLIDQNVKIISHKEIKPGCLTKDNNSIFPSNKTIISRHYSYDSVGSLTSIQDGFWGKIKYSYDSAQRLISAFREKGVAEKFSYDKNGNITNILQGTNGEKITYCKGDRIDRYGDTQYLFDSNGRLEKKVEHVGKEDQNEWLYTWDAKDQLLSIIRPDGVEWKYEYDALGRRIAKHGPDKTERFVWDKNVIIHHIENESVEETWLFGQNSFKPLCKLEKSELYPVITDHLGTPQELINKEGEIVWSISLKSWGSIDKVRIEKVKCPIRFQGQWFDEESELHYNRFRYYDPHIGCYISQDPAKLYAGLRSYNYCLNPIKKIDPFGLEETILTEGIVYRGGSATDSNLTPRPIKDTEGPKKGLSAFTTIEKATQPGGKAQKINISKLGPNLEAVLDDSGHVSIRPKVDPDATKLKSWAEQRGTKNNLTDEVKQAVEGEEKRPKKRPKECK